MFSTLQNYLLTSFGYGESKEEDHEHKPKKGLNSGTRLVLSPDLFKTNIVAGMRGGVVIGYVPLKSKKKSKGKSKEKGSNVGSRGYMVALDYPINERPSKEEIDFANTIFLQSPFESCTEQNFKVIESHQAEIDEQGIDEDKSDALEICAGCTLIKRRRDMLVICRHKHCICISHAIPCIDGSETPDLRRPEVNQFFTICQQFVHQDKASMVLNRKEKYLTKALLLAFRLKTIRNKLQFVQGHLQNFSLPCSICATNQSEEICDVDYIDRQLFTRQPTLVQEFLNSSQRGLQPYNQQPHNQRQDDVDPLPENFRTRLLAKGCTYESIQRFCDCHRSDRTYLSEIDFDMAFAMCQSFARVDVQKMSQVPENDGINFETCAGLRRENKGREDKGFFSNNFELQLLASICVTVRYPALKKSSRVSLERGMTLKDIIKQICRSREFQIATMDACKLFCRVGQSDSHFEIPWHYAIDDIVDDYNMGVDQLKDDAIILISTMGGSENVGFPQELRLLCSKFHYNPNLVNFVHKLREIFVGWRPIRGDGNCYFRAVIFGLIEQIIVSEKRREQFSILAEKFSTTSDLDSHNGSPFDHRIVLPLNDLIALLRSAANNDKWRTLDEFESDVLNPQTGVDLSLVVACRRLVSNFLRKNQDTNIVEGDSTALTYAESILPLLDKESTMEEYCVEFVETLDVNAEGTFVQKSILERSLNCWSTKVLLHRETLEAFQEPPPVGEICLGSVYILLIPGHYDMLYALRPSNSDGSPRFSLEEMKALMAGEIKEFVAEDIKSRADVQTVMTNTAPSPTPPRVIVCCSYQSLQNGLLLHDDDAVVNSRRVYFNGDNIITRIKQSDIFGIPQSYRLSLQRDFLQESKQRLYDESDEGQINASDGEIFHVVIEEVVVVSVAFEMNGQQLKRRFNLDKGFFLDAANFDNAVRVALGVQEGIKSIIAVESDQPGSLVELTFHHLQALRNNDSIFIQNSVKVNVVFGKKIETMEVQYLRESIDAFRLEVLRLFRLDSNIVDVRLLRDDDSALQELKPLKEGESIYLHATLPVLVQKRCRTSAPRTLSIDLAPSQGGGERDAIVSLERAIRSAYQLNAPYLLLTFESGQKIESINMLTRNTLILFSYCQMLDVFSPSSSSSSSSSSYFDPQCLKSFCAELITFSEKGGCPHTVCADCLNYHLSRSAIKREKLGAEYMESDKTVMSIFLQSPISPNEAFSFGRMRKFGRSLSGRELDQTNITHYLGLTQPRLVHIPCPIQGCTHTLGADLIDTTRRYEQHEAIFIAEVEDYLSKAANFVKCGLSEIVCESPYEPKGNPNFICLGCDHFFHLECLGSCLKVQIDDIFAKPQRRVIQCPQCTEEKMICPAERNCTNCTGGGGHVVTHFEMTRLSGSIPVGYCGRYQELMAEYVLQQDKNESMVRCQDPKCQETYTIPKRFAGRTLRCPQCNLQTCFECSKPDHPGVTCRENHIAEVRKLADEAQIMIQECPFCQIPWGVPVDCLHATCTPFGCGGEFCYLCVAPRTPTVAHSNNYHRPECTFWSKCCEKDCTTVLGKPHCDEAKYMAKPCDACITNQEVCSHTDWKPCYACRMKAIDCTHWCVECTQKGSICSVPGNPDNRFRVYTHDQVKEEERRQNLAPGPARAGAEQESASAEI